MIAFASSLDQVGPVHARRHATPRCCCASSPAATRATRPRVGIAGAGRAARRATDLAGPPPRRAEGARPGEGDRARRARGVRARRSSWSRELGAEVERVRPAARRRTASRAYYLIAPAEASSNLARYDGVRYGLRADGDGDLLEMYERTRDAGLRRRGQAPDHARHLRALLRLLRRLLRPGAEGAHADRRSDFTTRLRAASTSSSRRPRRRVAFALGAKTDDPLAMYLNDFCTVPMSLAGIPAISIPCGLVARACRSGFQLVGPAFGENRSSTRPTRSSRRSASTPSPERLRMSRLGAGDRPGDPRPAQDADEDVLRLRAVGFGDEPNTHTCPVCLGLPGRAAGDQRAGDRATAIKIGLALDCEIAAALDLPPQELLLSRPPEGLPDLPVRHPALRSGGAACGDVAASHRVAPRGGRGEARPRRRVGPDPRLRRLARRLQPRRHAAGRDRHRAGHPLGRARRATGCSCCAQTLASSASPTSNMEEGTLRSTPTSPSARRARRAAARKTELKNMNSFRFIERGHRRRDRAPDRACCEAGERGRAGDAALRPATRHAHARCARRRRRTTTATSPSPTSCRSRRPRRCSRGRARALPELPAERAARYERDWGLPEDTARLFAFEPELGRLLRAGGRRRGRDAEADRELGRRSCARAWRRRRPGASPVVPAQLAKLAGLVAAKHGHAPAPPARCSTSWSPSGGDPAEIVEREGLDRDGGRRRARRRSWPR